jgi:hypothetical protein
MIIVVPPATMTKARINMKNALHFFESGNYVPHETITESVRGPLKCKFTNWIFNIFTNFQYFKALVLIYAFLFFLFLVSRAMFCDRPNVVFRIFDSTDSFSKLDWALTCCIVVHGKQWQLSGFPFSSVADCFSSYKGVFFK